MNGVGYVFWCTPCGKDHAGECPPKVIVKAPQSSGYVKLFGKYVDVCLNCFGDLKGNIYVCKPCCLLNGGYKGKLMDLGDQFNAGERRFIYGSGGSPAQPCPDEIANPQKYPVPKPTTPGGMPMLGTVWAAETSKDAGLTWQSSSPYLFQVTNGFGGTVEIEAIGPGPGQKHQYAQEHFRKSGWPSPHSAALLRFVSKP